MNENSVVFYEGPSALDGHTPIVGVLTGLRGSLNRKTGDMLQAWILVRDIDPTAAIKSGGDAAICGDCALRGDREIGRGCYVTYWQAPLKIWQHLGNMRRMDPFNLARSLTGSRIRLGAYGDPTAIPVTIWRDLMWRSNGVIGYTQQWRVCHVGYRAFLMASVLSTVDAAEAQALGWRTYRVRGPKDALLEGEVVCPASVEAEHKATCDACMLCSGTLGGRRANPVIMVHGKAGNFKAFGVPFPDRIRVLMTGRPKNTIALRPV